MFTGLVQALGTVRDLSPSRIMIEATFSDERVELGESIAVNGCCLTVVAAEPLAFDLSPETLRRTALANLKQGDPVNLERAMKASSRFGGHIVQGHVDGVAEVIEVQPLPEEMTRFRFRLNDSEGARYLIDKGSVAIDGISLTVVNPSRNEFDVWVIPHTMRETTLRHAQVGVPVNVEYDVVAKYVERLTGFASARQQDPA